jgi:hypothetical protein
MTTRIEGGGVMRKNNATHSVRRLILLVFVIALFFSVALFGAVVFSNSNKGYFI